MQSTIPNACLSRGLCQHPTAPGLAGRAWGSLCPAGHWGGIPRKAGIPEAPSLWKHRAAQTGLGRDLHTKEPSAE